MGEYDPETGEILTRTGQVARAERWALKSVVNRLLPGERVSKCMVLRAPLPGQGLAPIEVHKGQTHGKAFYHGLMACGSVWTCPVCSAKIAERRRDELKVAVQHGVSKGWGIHFVTLTVPHGIGDDLHELLARQSKALDYMSRSQYFRRLKASLDLDVLGYIRAREVTYGQNGWHPHFHMIVFTPADCVSSVVEYAYKKVWHKACAAAGLPEPHADHGCTVQDGRFAAKYVSKWGIEDEMTKSHAKRGKRHGLSPWGLLRASLNGGSDEIAAEPAAKLFQLYAHAFRGLRQLYWSVGLRSKLLPNQPEMTDQELADRAEDERSALLAELSTEQWLAVRRARAESSLLDAAESDPRVFGVVLARIMERFGRAGGAAKCPQQLDLLDDFLPLPPPDPELSGGICPLCHLVVGVSGVCHRHGPPPAKIDLRLADIGRIRLPSRR